MKFILFLFLFLILLPIVFSIDQISDDQTQPATTSSDSQQAAETPETSPVETQNTGDQTQAQTPPQAAESTTPPNDPQPAETAPQTTPQNDPQPAEPTPTPQETQPVAQTSTDTEEKSTTSATPTQSAPQETQPVAQTPPENEEKSTTSTAPVTPITQKPSSISDEASKSATPKTSPSKTKQSSLVYVTADDNSSCKGLCLSGGVCKDDVCICPPGFSGERCELVFDANETKYQTKMDAVVTKYYFALIGFVGLIAVMVLSECCCKGGSENPPKEDLPIEQDQGQKYVDLDLEAGPVADKSHADVEADVVPVQAEEPVQNHAQPEGHYVEPQVEPEVVPVEEHNYAEPEFVPVEEPQHYAEPEEVIHEEQRSGQY